ncbi:MAG TPA: hypothetical protein VGC41_00830 [Kofleriaceae bacterium]
MAKTVELVIDELILHGFAATDRARIGDAVHAELVRRASAFQDLASRPSLDAGSFTVPRDANATAIGTSIATSIADGLVGGKR